VAEVPQVSILAPVLYSLYINYAPAASGTHLALFADDNSNYATEKHERRVLCKLPRDLTAVKSWCERRNIKINEGKTGAIYFSKIFRVHDDVLQLNRRDIPFVNSVTYFDISFDRRMTWRHNVERTVAKALRTFKFK
jgi:hypothetical protein